MDSPHLLVNTFFHRTSKFEAENQRLSQPQWLAARLCSCFCVFSTPLGIGQKCLFAQDVNVSYSTASTSM